MIDPGWTWSSIFTRREDAAATDGHPDGGTVARGSAVTSARSASSAGLVDPATAIPRRATIIGKVQAYTLTPPARIMALCNSIR